MTETRRMTVKLIEARIEQAKEGLTEAELSMCSSYLENLKGLDRPDRLCEGNFYWECVRSIIEKNSLK